MKIKVIRRFERFLAPEGCEEEVYDIYHGFTGLPMTWPFHTKWVIDKAGVSREEALKCDVIVDVKLGDADYLDQLDGPKILCGWAHCVQNIEFTSAVLNAIL